MTARRLQLPLLVVVGWGGVNLVAYLFFRADGDGPDPIVHERGFVSKTYVGPNGYTHRYVVFLPIKREEGEKPPLMLFLHGAGQRGSNGIDPIMCGIGPALYNEFRDLPFVVAFPQCWKGGNWQAEDDDARRALAILAVTADEYDTDPNRVYLTGLSMGGSGTWSIAARHPHGFAAIVPICGRGDLAAAKTIADARLPTWIFCGDQDHPHTVASCRDMHRELLKFGCNARYTEYAGVGHNCWDRAYGTRGLYDWLLTQRRSDSVLDARNDDAGAESRKSSRGLGVSATASRSGLEGGEEDTRGHNAPRAD